MPDLAWRQHGHLADEHRTDRARCGGASSGLSCNPTDGVNGCRVRVFATIIRPPGRSLPRASRRARRDNLASDSPGCTTRCSSRYDGVLARVCVSVPLNRFVLFKQLDSRGFVLYTSPRPGRVTSSGIARLSPSCNAESRRPCVRSAELTLLRSWAGRRAMRPSALRLSSSSAVGSCATRVSKHSTSSDRAPFSSI